MTLRSIHTLLFVAIFSLPQLNTLANDECSANAEYTYETANHTAFFTNLSTSSTAITGYFWEFGDGVTSLSPEPIYAYADYGTYTCCLTVSSASDEGTCEHTFCMEVTVDEGGACQVESDFSVEHLINGEAMFLPDAYTNAGTAVEGYSWSFDGLGTSTDEAPLWQFNAVEHYDICLTTHATNGGSQCTDVECKEVAIDNFICEMSAEFKATIEDCSVALDYYELLGAFTTLDDCQWTISDGTELSGAHVYHTFAESGSYEVCLTISGECPSSSCETDWCTTVEVVCPQEEETQLPDLSDLTDGKDDESDDTSTEVEDFLQQVEIQIYPNPAVDYVNISTETRINYIELYSTTGSLVQQVIQPGSTQHILDLSGLETGAYVYRVQCEDSTPVSGQLLVR